MAHMVKWKFRNCEPGKKNHTINNYIKYVSDQVINRREGTGVFEHQNIMGMNDDKVIADKIAKDDSYDQGIYLKYINERKGSSGMFSSDGANITQLQESVKNHKGAVWIPIVSLKEDEARLYGLDTEASWIVKGRELAEEYRKVLGIAPENYHWVAAFHTKAPADQNPLTDSGCQPHLHFMLWEETPIRRLYKLNDTEMERVHQVTANVLSRDYMQKRYNDRNELEAKVKENALDSIDKYADDIKSLFADIKIMTQGKGKLNVRELQKREDIAIEILDNLETKTALTQAQMYYQEKLGIHNLYEARKVSLNYVDINERLDRIAEDAMHLPGVADVLDKWTDISLDMRRAQDDTMKYEMLRNDYEQIKKEIKNAILKEARSSMKENIYISDELKGQLYDKLANGRYGKDFNNDVFIETTEVLAKLCKAVDMPENDAVSLQQDLLERSDKSEYEMLAQQIIETVYKDVRIGSFNVTTRDFWNAMKSMQTPISKTDTRSMYSMGNNSPYSTITHTVLQPISHQVITDEYGQGAINALIEGLGATSMTKADYASIYTALLNSMHEEQEIDEPERVLF